MGREQCLRMTSDRKIDRDVVRIGITHAVQVYRGIQASPLCSSNWWKRTQEVVETNPGPPSNATPSFHAYETRDLLMNYKLYLVHQSLTWRTGTVNPVNNTNK
jgi:hypothetical protein